MNWKKNSIFLIFVLFSCIPILLTFNRGINYFDEGYILEGARRILAGEIPYRDFHFIYTPGTIYFLSFFFRLFGEYIIVERIVDALLSFIGIIFLGLIVRKETKNDLLTFLSMLIYSLWGPTHLNFLWPVMCVLPLIFIYFFLFIESHFFLAGVAAALVLLYKHNFGGALVISFICSALFVHYSKRRVLRLLLGFMSVFITFIMYLVFTRSLTPFLLDMYRYSIQEILIHKSFSVPFPTDSAAKFLLYAIPGIVSFVLMILIIVKKSNKSVLIVPMTLFFVYLFGIFPTPDWPHLTPLLSSIGISIALFPLVFRKKYISLLSYLLMVLIISGGLYGVIVRNYYRWEAPLIKHTHCFSSGVMKYLCIDEKNYAMITQTVPLIEKETAQAPSIFSFYNNPIYYFLTRKNNPTEFIDFNVLIGKKDELKVINELVQKRVKIVITRFPPQNNKSTIISGYIEKYYEPIHSVYEFTVWKMR